MRWINFSNVLKLIVTNHEVVKTYPLSSCKSWPPFFLFFWVCNFSVLTRSFSFTTYFIIYWDVKWEVVQYNSYIILCWLIFYYAPIMTYHICNNLILFYEHYHHCHYYYRVEVLMYYTCMHSKMGVDNFVVLKNMWKN